MRIRLRSSRHPTDVFQLKTLAKAIVLAASLVSGKELTSGVDPRPQRDCKYIYFMLFQLFFLNFSMT